MGMSESWWSMQVCDWKPDLPLANGCMRCLARSMSPSVHVFERQYMPIIWGRCEPSKGAFYFTRLRTSTRAWTCTDVRLSTSTCARQRTSIRCWIQHVHASRLLTLGTSTLWFIIFCISWNKFQCENFKCLLLGQYCSVFIITSHSIYLIFQ